MYTPFFFFFFFFFFEKYEYDQAEFFGDLKQATLRSSKAATR